MAKLPVVHAVGDDVAILDAIRDALENNRIDLYLQPIVSLPQRKVRYFEAFSRLRDASGTVLTPDRYLAVAERSGMIATIDNLLLFRCTQLLRRFKRLKKNISFFCNLSAHTLRDDKFFEQFTDFLASQPGLAENMIFEVGNAELAGGAGTSKLDRLKAMGFRLSLDQVPDLNVDYAGLARRNFRFVKIEAAKLLSVANQARATIAPIDLKEALRRNGIDLIAEKIESERTVIDLTDFDVDYGQGYLFGEPRPAREDFNLTANKVA
jgi:cyclic-di-GMP phosphodiesterase TipF (flagellum assembly factor)